jgi:hypothetical protein
VLSKTLIVLVTIPVCLLLFIAGGPEPVFLPLVQEAPGFLRLFPNLLARRISWIILKVSLVSLRTLAKQLTIYKAQASENQTNRGLENK